MCEFSDDRGETRACSLWMKCAFGLGPERASCQPCELVLAQGGLTFTSEHHSEPYAERSGPNLARCRHRNFPREAFLLQFEAHFVQENTHAQKQ